MQKAKTGDQVTVHYIGTLDNGRIFDQREADEPLIFKLGAGQVFPALEEQILGMAIGETINVLLSAEQAYGPRLKENLLYVPRELFPPEQALEVGQKLRIELAGREQRIMRIRRVDDNQVLLDGNHDLAGCGLTFALQLVAIG